MEFGPEEESGTPGDVFIGGGAGYTKLKARRPAGKGKKKQQEQRRSASSR
jgi:hypothetical protein